MSVSLTLMVAALVLAGPAAPNPDVEVGAGVEQAGISGLFRGGSRPHRPPRAEGPDSDPDDPEDPDDKVDDDDDPGGAAAAASGACGPLAGCRWPYTRSRCQTHAREKRFGEGLFAPVCFYLSPPQRLCDLGVADRRAGEPPTDDCGCVGACVGVVDACVGSCCSSGWRGLAVCGLAEDPLKPPHAHCEEPKAKPGRPSPPRPGKVGDAVVY